MIISLNKYKNTEVETKPEEILHATIKENGTSEYFPSEGAVFSNAQIVTDIHPSEQLKTTIKANGTTTFKGEYNGAEIIVEVANSGTGESDNPLDYLIIDEYVVDDDGNGEIIYDIQQIGDFYLQIGSSKLPFAAFTPEYNSIFYKEIDGKQYRGFEYNGLGIYVEENTDVCSNEFSFWGSRYGLLVDNTVSVDAPIGRQKLCNVIATYGDYTKSVDAYINVVEYKATEHVSMFYEHDVHGEMDVTNQTTVHAYKDKGNYLIIFLRLNNLNGFDNDAMRDRWFSLFGINVKNCAVEYAVNQNWDTISFDFLTQDLEVQENKYLGTLEFTYDGEVFDTKEIYLTVIEPGTGQIDTPYEWAQPVDTSNYGNPDEAKRVTVDEFKNATPKDPDTQWYELEVTIDGCPQVETGVVQAHDDTGELYIVYTTTSLSGYVNSTFQYKFIGDGSKAIIRTLKRTINNPNGGEENEWFGYFENGTVIAGKYYSPCAIIVDSYSDWE